MLTALISSKIRRAILKQVLNHPEDKYYVRQLATMLVVSVGSLHKELIKLEKEGILKSEFLGNLRLFYANKQYFLYKEIKQIITKAK